MLLRDGNSIARLPTHILISKGCALKLCCGTLIAH
jgi:hypothetical protein